MKKVEEFYKELGDLTQQEKDDIMRGLLLALANCPVYGSHNFREDWYKWRQKVDYYLSFTTFGRIVNMLLELRRLRFIKKMLNEIKEPLTNSVEAKIIIDGKEYSCDFLYSALSLLEDEDINV